MGWNPAAKVEFGEIKVLLSDGFHGGSNAENEDRSLAADGGK